jgi:hypothetical protein
LGHNDEKTSLQFPFKEMMDEAACKVQYEKILL